MLLPECPAHDEQMFQRAYYIAVAIVALLTLLVLNLPSRTTARLKLAIGSVFLPLFGMAGGAQQVSARTADNLLPKSELIRANESLRKQNMEMRMQLQRADSVSKENDRLRQLLNRPRQPGWNVRLANVLSRDPANWWRTIQIDLGSRDGLSNNVPVLSADGFLIGRISAVSITRSQVVLVGDANCKVSALVENDARDAGVISSGGLFDGSFVKLSYLPNNANLKPGQKVFTSGLGGIFPKGIPIGVVADSRQVESGLYSEAQVKLSAKLSSLEEVWILFP